MHDFAKSQDSPAHLKNQMELAIMKQNRHARQFGGNIMLHRSIMLHAEDRIHVLITRLRESAAPPERQALLDELTEIEASVHEVAHSVVDYQHVMDELDDNILVADKDEVVLYVNDAYIRHTGIAPGDRHLFYRSHRPRGNPEQEKGNEALQHVRPAG